MLMVDGVLLINILILKGPISPALFINTTLSGIETLIAPEFVGLFSPRPVGTFMNLLWTRSDHSLKEENSQIQVLLTRL